jgi:hypothetical protein
MKPAPPEQFRYAKNPLLYSDAAYGMNGMFMVPYCGKILQCIASDGSGWEHVSVSIGNGSKTIKRCATWDEMCFVKNLFWEPEETVVQFHPAKSEYVNNHPYCLHLWRPTDGKLQTPPNDMVGVKT